MPVTYTAADVASADRTLAAADKCMLGSLALSTSLVVASEWRTGGSFAAGADATDANYQARRAYDGFTDLATRPNAAGVTWYYMIDASTAGVTFDGAMILGHNFGTIGGLTVTLQISDSSTFVTNLIDIAVWTPGTSNVRLVDLVLESGGETAQRYSTVPYVRLKITGTSGVPEIGELVLFKRMQLQYKPSIPYDDQKLWQNSGQFLSASGVRQDYVRSRAGRRLEASLTVTSTAKIAEVRTWFDDTQQGTRPFVWSENPNSAPSTQTFLMSLDGENKELAFDEVGPNHRELVLGATEQGPDYQKLEA